MNIRNFVIISHVDHGKSTLADRLLELTGAVERRRMREQFLDQMELEREKGITIKMQPVRMLWQPRGAEPPYMLNLIDTPGHVDFSYEVSRALAAVEGAILLVDATQGIQAQTLANLELARREGLAIVPAVNKIDLPAARPDEVAEEIASLLEMPAADVLRISGKTGAGVPELLAAMVRAVPPPSARADKPAPMPRALIFDSHFDPYRGVIAHVRVTDGTFRHGAKVWMAATRTTVELMEIGTFAPELKAGTELGAGEIGYFATGLKEADAVRVGDTVLGEMGADAWRFPGYREPAPMVFASLYPEDADMYERLLDALKKIRLNDAALSFEPESSDALGRGFRAGFLGMLHMEIVAERLRREYGIALVTTIPSVAYRVIRINGAEEFIYAAGKFPDLHAVREVREPWVRLEIITPQRFMGSILELVRKVRGTPGDQRYLGGDRMHITAEAPLRDVLVDFFDALKSATEGYASLSYEPIGERLGDLVRLDIVIADEREDALAQVVPSERAYQAGRAIVAKLKELLPKALFPIPLQAAANGRIIARETIPALKKDVTGYLYGGDRTRKMKLWKKQQRGKKRLTERGRVEIPPDVFLQILKR
ncbi:elongation factor 4 [Candidatus Parcubacteria bacterium]|nr:MAG: elongation factor 4 [Candidatus Parcubacteria bacterium]